jgi:glucokinase
MKDMCVGIDLGGTYIKLALLDRDLRLCGTLRRPTPADRGPEGVIEAIVSAARELMEREGSSDDQVAGVGIGSPGPLDLAEGMVLGMPNIPGFDHVPLRNRVEEGLGLPAVLENDANAAALGEFLVGRGRDVRHMVMLTLGTGVGSGIVIDGRLLHGAHGVGAELGHLIVEADGEPCGCGQRGCLERYASATYLAEYARRLIESGGRSGPLAERLAANGRIDARDVQQARAAGDETAAPAWGRRASSSRCRARRAVCRRALISGQYSSPAFPGKFP